MAGKVILIALGCAISGLLMTAPSSTTRLVFVQRESCGVDSSSRIYGESTSGASRLPDTDRRLSPIVLEESNPNNQKHWEGRRATSERSMGKERQHDPALMVSAEFIKTKQKLMDGIAILDVRDRWAFEQYRIPGSINVPLHAVKTKSFLRSTILILVNEGFPSAALEEECRQLKASGFMVWLLEGGLNAWRESGGSMDGEPRTQSILNRVSPQNLLAERDSDRWIAVDACGSRNTNKALPFPRVIPLDAPGNTEDSNITLMKYLEKEKHHSPLFFVVFNEDGRQYEKVETTIRKAGIKNAFYLTNGLEGYSAFLDQRTAIIQKTDISRRPVGKCAGCP